MSDPTGDGPEIACPKCGGYGCEHPQNTPGSEGARRSGCRCPVLDNHHGAGLPDGSFWINSDCPVHGSARLITAEDRPHDA